MMPLPMNEYLQQALAECYFDVQLDVIEWNTLLTNWRRGAKDPSANGSNAVNVTYAAMDPFFALVRFLQSSMAPPVSNNWGFINNPEIRRAGHQGAADLRSRRARCGAGRTACGLRRRRGVPLCRPRRRAARDEPEDQGIRAAEELVRRLLADLHDAVSVRWVMLFTLSPRGRGWLREAKPGEGLSRGDRPLIRRGMHRIAQSRHLLPQGEK